MSRLVFFLPNVTGGVLTYVTNLCSFLESKKIDYKIVTYSHSDFFLHKSIETEFNGIRLIKLVFSSFSTRPSQYNLIKNQIEKDDIVISNNSIELYACAYYKLKNKIVYIFHGDLEHYYNTVKGFQNNIDLILCVSKTLMLKVKTFFLKNDVDYLFPIVYGLDSNEIKKSREKISILFVGRFEFAKGADVFVELSNSFKNNKYDHVEWVVITTKDSLDENLFNKLPIFVKVIYDLSNKEVLKIMGQSDIFLFPSRSEGFGIVILESMKMSMVPIVHDLPVAIPDIIKNGLEGYLVKVGYIENYKNLLLKLLENEKLLREMQKTAFLNSHQNFNNNSIVDSFLLKINLLSTKHQDKKNQNVKINFLEKVIPEYFYRVLKIIKKLIKN